MKHLTFKTIAIAVLIALSVNVNSQNTGPAAPETMSFEPVDAANMVNLNTGDFVYSIPIINIPGPGGGYPLALSYHGGIALDQEASWVGLGWTLNPGAINRGVMAVPDDYKNAKETTYIINQNGTYTQRSVGLAVIIKGISAGAALTWNSNWSRWTVSPYVGVDGYSVGLLLGTEFGVNAGVGIPGTAAYVGVGVSSQGISGSVGMGPASMSVNFSGGETSYGLNLGTTLGTGTKLASSASVGISLSSNGNVSNGMSIGASSFATGNNYNVNRENYVSEHSGWVVPLIFFNLSYDNYNFWYHDTKSQYTNGMLYLKDSYVAHNENGQFQNEDFGTDVLVMPYSMEEAVSSENAECSPNLMTPGNDFYIVNAQGLNGRMSLNYYEHALLTGQFKNKKIDDKDGSITKKLYYAYNAGADNDGIPQEEKLKKMWEMDNINPFFYFDDAISSSINISPLTFENFDADSMNPFTGAYKVNPTEDELKSVTGSIYNNRKVGGNFVQFFTNDEIVKNIANCRARGFLETNSIPANYGRTEKQYFPPNGIGAYIITTNDGVSYHYALPVYQFEEFQIHKKRNAGNNDLYMYMREEPYAYTWLLTAITGPDFIDKGIIEGEIDDADQGYWVKFIYGNWSNAYLWKTPFIEADFETMGRKQIYYLDEIETKTHIAYFVKEKRNDAHSATVDATYTPSIGSIGLLEIPGEPRGFNHRIYEADGTFLGNGYSRYDVSGIDYDIRINADSVFPLRLKNILLVEKSNRIPNFNSLSNWHDNFNTHYSASVTSLYKDVYYVYNWTDSTNFIKGNYDEGPWWCGSGSGPLNWKPCERFVAYSLIKYNFNKSLNIAECAYIIDVNDYNSLNIKPEIIKEIRFNYDDNNALCKNAPNSPDGKLTLQSVQFLGQDSYPMMPPYVFQYYRHDVNYDTVDADKWGFHKVFADNWSLNKIVTPTGAELEIEYESDSYHTEAVFNRIQEETEFVITGVDHSHTDSRATFRCTLPSGKTFANITGFDATNNYVFIKAEARVLRDRLNQHPVSFISVNEFFPITIISANQFLVTFDYGMNYLYNPGDYSYSAHLDKCVLTAINPDATGVGGGCRVKQISLSDGQNVFTTNYNYNFPNTESTSGVTSYAPGHKLSFIPLPSEVPAPCVYYQYVTVSNDQDFTTYEFEVPQVSTNSDAPEFSLGDQLTVVDINPNTNLYSSTGLSISNHEIAYARSAVISNKTSRIGRALSVKRQNSFGDIISDQKYEYYDGELSLGINQETYYYLKEIYDFYHDVEYYFVSTTRRTVPSILKAIHTSAGGNTNSTFYSDFDINTGAALKTTTVLHQNGIEDYSSATAIPNKLYEASVEVIPAYTLSAYSSDEGDDLTDVGMNSKVYNIYNKNMLTQTAATLTKKNGKVIDVSIQTWKGDWANYYGKYGYLSWNATTGRYDYNGTDNGETIWRKHKTYIWNGDLDAEGYYGSDFANFNSTDNIKLNWGSIVSEPTTSKWLKTSEVIRYDHYSSPIEAMDINGDYAATKKDPDQLHTVATAANARHSQFAHCGFEYGPYIDPHGETGTYVRNRTKHKSIHEVHTGEYCLEISPSLIGVEYRVSTTELYYWQFPAIYRVSVWKYNEWNGSPSPEDLSISGPGTAVASDTFRAGNWVLYTKDFSISSKPTSDISFKVTNSGGQYMYIDDFRVSPFEAAVTAYTYDNAGNVTAILNNDNFAVKYEYDAAGRLISTYVEKPTGFEKLSSNKYNYGNQ